MRVLQVIHQFPPFSSQGSERHCLQLSNALAAAGDDVGVFHASNTSPRSPHRLVRGSAGPIRTYHCIEDGQHSRLADWPNRFLAGAFRETMAEFMPDVVHFHHYVSLGDDLVGMARDFGTAVVYTLHDYGLICPNHLLLRTDGAICSKRDPDFFEACCPVPIRCSGGRPPLIASRLPSLARWEQFADNQPHAVPRAALKSLVVLGQALMGSPEHTEIDAKRAMFLGHTRRIFDAAHLFIAPSRYLRERLLACGLPADRTVYERHGLPHFPRPEHGPSPDGKVRLGYIGAFHAHKGIEVLLRAFRGLDDRATLHIYGSSFGSPVSEAHFRRTAAAAGAGVVLHGRYDNSQLPEILGQLDAVVVPSVWVENSPLTIQEAQIAGVPVITANEGGMAELVRDGIDGRLFRLGDAADLHRVLAEVLDCPSSLRELRAHAPAVPTIEAQAERIRMHYARALARSLP
jgi:glycosyltransferase involved in cell wall biosynthesis